MVKRALFALAVLAMVAWLVAYASEERREYWQRIDAWNKKQSEISRKHCNCQQK